MAQKAAPTIPGLDAIEVHYESSGPCAGRVHLKAPADALARARSRILGHFRKRFRVKGFRPGKAPLSMVEKHYGKELDTEVLETFLGHAFARAVKENELSPAASPRVNLDGKFPKPGEDLETEFEIALRPKIELGELKGLSIEGQPVDVTDQEVDGAIEDLRRQNSRVEPAGEDGLEAEGMMLATVAYLADGEDEPLLEREGIRMSPKATPWGVTQEAFEAAVIGARQGEEREIPVESIPDEFPIEEARGKPGTLRVRLDEVFKVTPAADEELFAMLDVETESGLKQAVRARILDIKQSNENQRIEHALIDKVLEQHPFELPEPLVQDQVEGRMAELREGLIKEGLDEKTVEERVAAERPEAERATRQGLKAIYLFEAVAKKEDLKIQAEDIEREFASIARRNGSTVEEVRKYYQSEQGLVNQLGIELLERKVRSFLRESADIQGTAGS